MPRRVAKSIRRRALRLFCRTAPNASTTVIAPDLVSADQSNSSNLSTATIITKKEASSHLSPNEGAEDDLLCPIAMCNLDIPKQIVTTACGHTFCTTCLDVWLHQYGNKTCPSCRSNISQHCDLGDDEDLCSPVAARIKTHCGHTVCRPCLLNRYAVYWYRNERCPGCGQRVDWTNPTTPIPGRLAAESANLSQI